eukprot:190477-Chlamydomonas_euryale.AAC.1
MGGQCGAARMDRWAVWGSKDGWVGGVGQQGWIGGRCGAAELGCGVWSAETVVQRPCGVHLTPSSHHNILALNLHCSHPL